MNTANNYKNKKLTAIDLRFSSIDSNNTATQIIKDIVEYANVNKLDLKNNNFQQLVSDSVNHPDVYELTLKLLESISTATCAAKENYIHLSNVNKTMEKYMNEISGIKYSISKRLINDSDESNSYYHTAEKTVPTLPEFYAELKLFSGLYEDFSKTTRELSKIYESMSKITMTLSQIYADVENESETIKTGYVESCGEKAKKDNNKLINKLINSKLLSGVKGAFTNIFKAAPVLFIASLFGGDSVILPIRAGGRMLVGLGDLFFDFTFVAKQAKCCSVARGESFIYN